MNHDQINYGLKLYIYIYMISLTRVKLTIFKLIVVQLPMEKLITIKTNHN
jgi:hypothetical protein